MHTAAKDGDEYTMVGLVKLGADINIKDNDGVSETTAGRFSTKHSFTSDLGMQAKCKERNCIS